MTDAEARKKLAAALRAINKLLYASGAPLGSLHYFEIRGLCVGTLQDCHEPVNDVTGVKP